MTVTEAAKELNLATFTVRQKCNKGEIAPAYKAGRAWVIESSAIPAYRNRQRVQGANAPTRALIKRGLLPEVGIERMAGSHLRIPKGMIADSIARVFAELDSIEAEISKAPPQGMGEKKAQAVNLGRIQSIRDVLYELKGSAVMGEIAHREGISEGTIYRWKAKFGGMEVSEAQRLRSLKEENRRLKRLVADQALDIQMLKDVNSKNGKARNTARPPSI